MTKKVCGTQFTRCGVMKRAWQLAKLNRRNFNEKYHPDFSKWLKLAWQEMREGNIEYWAPVFNAPEARLQRAKQAVAVAEAAPWGLKAGDTIVSARNELNRLQQAT